MKMHVITDFSGQGGAQAMLARLLSQAKEKTVVVALTEVSDRSKDLAGNPEVIYVSLRARSLAAVPRAIWQLKGLIQKHKPDAVLCWMYHAMVIGILAGKLANTGSPIYWTVRQALDDPASFSRSTRIALRLSRLLSRLSAGIIYNSNRALEQHGKFGFADSNSVVIPNGFVLPERPVEREGPARVFGLAARFNPQKDFSTLFEAFAIARKSIPDMRLIAAGDGVTTKTPGLRELLSRHDLPPDSVELCGDLHDMDAFYCRIDAFVLSSRTEGFPNVIAEAMSHGRPVISTDAGDARAIVGDCGVVVPPRDAAALASAIVDAGRWTKREYRRKSLCARERIAARYSLAIIAEAYDAMLGGSEPTFREASALRSE